MAKPKSPSSRASSVRQSVTIPHQLAVKVRRVAKERHLTMSRALVELVQRGIDAETETRENLDTAYQRFMIEADSERKSEAGKDLIRAVFGPDALAKDSIR
jgi:hypothetical protein